MSDGTPVTPEYDARMLADLRAWRARVSPTSLEGNRWSMRLTIDELDALLRIADERDALRRASCAEWEADIPTEVRERAAAPSRLAVVDETPDPAIEKCGGCGAAIVRDPHSTTGWRHAVRPSRIHAAKPIDGTLA